MQVKSLVFLVTLVAAAVADNSGCPHPEEAKNIVLQQTVIVDPPVDGRHVEHMEVPGPVLGRTDLSCITVVSGRQGSTPDYVAFGRNKKNGYSIILHSRIRNPLNATLFVYTT